MDGAEVEAEEEAPAGEHPAVGAAVEDHGGGDEQR
jgi:hypothetical protein